jgi:hypothetical protein
VDNTLAKKRLKQAVITLEVSSFAICLSMKMKEVAKSFGLCKSTV